jgi:hypothetical protein
MRDDSGRPEVWPPDRPRFHGRQPERQFKEPFVYGASAGTTWDVLGPQHRVRGVYAWIGFGLEGGNVIGGRVDRAR